MNTNMNNSGAQNYHIELLFITNELYITRAQKLLLNIFTGLSHEMQL